MSTKTIPSGFTAITPHLVCKDADAAIRFYTKVFGMEEVNRLQMPDGKVMHADLKLGNTTLWLAEENRERGLFAPAAPGASPVSLNLYVANADKAFALAIEQGATPLMPVQDMFWGDRYGRLVDPFGHNWGVAQRMRDLTPAEVRAAFAAAFAG